MIYHLISSSILPVINFEYGVYATLPYLKIIINGTNEYNLFWFLDVSEIRVLIDFMVKGTGLYIIGGSIVDIVKGLPHILQGNWISHASKLDDNLHELTDLYQDGYFDDLAHYDI